MSQTKVFKNNTLVLLIIAFCSIKILCNSRINFSKNIKNRQLNDSNKIVDLKNSNWCTEGNFLDDGSCVSCSVFYSIQSKNNSKAFTQLKPPQECLNYCGDGYLNISSGDLNTCDDGNQISGDGCDSNCRIEEGFDCYRGGQILNEIIKLKTAIDFDKFYFPVFKDICQKKQNTQLYTESDPLNYNLLPVIKIKWNKSICLNTKQFFKTFDQITVTLDNKVDKVQFQNLDLVEIKKCKEYQISYTLGSTYEGPIKLIKIHDEQSLFKTYTPHSKELVKNLSQTAETDLKFKYENYKELKKMRNSENVINIQGIFYAPLLFILCIIYEPLADWGINVLQKIILLQFINISWPKCIEVLFMVFSNWISYNYFGENLLSQGDNNIMRVYKLDFRYLGVDINIDEFSNKFLANGRSPLFLKSQLSPSFILIAVILFLIFAKKIRSYINKTVLCSEIIDTKPHQLSSKKFNQKFQYSKKKYEGRIENNDESNLSDNTMPVYLSKYSIKTEFILFQDLIIAIFLTLRYFSNFDMISNQTNRTPEANHLLLLNYLVAIFVGFVIMFRFQYFKKILKQINFSENHTENTINTTLNLIKKFYRSQIYPYDIRFNFTKQKNLYDVYIKKTILVFLLVFFEKNPNIVIGGFIMITMIDIVLCGMSLIRFSFMNFCMLIENIIYLILQTCICIFNLENITENTLSMLAIMFNIWCLILILFSLVWRSSILFSIKLNIIEDEVQNDLNSILSQFKVNGESFKEDNQNEHLEKFDEENDSSNSINASKDDDLEDSESNDPSDLDVSIEIIKPEKRQRKYRSIETRLSFVKDDLPAIRESENADEEEEFEDKVNYWKERLFILTMSVEEYNSIFSLIRNLEALGHYCQNYEKINNDKGTTALDLYSLGQNIKVIGEEEQQKFSSVRVILNNLHQLCHIIKDQNYCSYNSDAQDYTLRIQYKNIDNYWSLKSSFVSLEKQLKQPLIKEYLEVDFHIYEDLIQDIEVYNRWTNDAEKIPRKTDNYEIIKGVIELESSKESNRTIKLPISQNSSQTTGGQDSKYLFYNSKSKFLFNILDKDHSSSEYKLCPESSDNSFQLEIEEDSSKNSPAISKGSPENYENKKVWNKLKGYAQ